MTDDQIKLMQMIIHQQEIIIECNYQMLQLIAPISDEQEETRRTLQ